MLSGGMVGQFREPEPRLRKKWKPRVSPKGAIPACLTFLIFLTPDLTVFHFRIWPSSTQGVPKYRLCLGSSIGPRIGDEKEFWLEITDGT